MEGLKKQTNKPKKTEVSPAHIAGAFAAAIGAVSPAMAETPVATEPVGGNGVVAEMSIGQNWVDNLSIDNRAFAESIVSTDIPEAIKQIQDRIKYYGAVRLIRVVKRLNKYIKAIEKNKDNPQYIQGLSILKKNFNDIQYYIANVSPDQIKDIEHIKNLLLTIPEELRNKFMVSAKDFDGSNTDSTQYEGASFAQAVNFFSDSGYIAKSSDVQEFIDAPGNLGLKLEAWLKLAPVLTDNIWILSRYLKEGKITPENLENTEFIDFVRGLADTGISTYILFSLGDKGEPILTNKKVNNPMYTQNLIKLRELGYGINGKMLQMLSVEMVTSGSFIENMKTLKGSGILYTIKDASMAMLNLKHMLNLLSDKNLSNVVSTLQTSGVSGHWIGQALIYANKSGNAWTTLQQVVEYTKKKENIIYFYTKLDIKTLDDKAYREAYLAYVDDFSKGKYPGFGNNYMSMSTLNLNYLDSVLPKKTKEYLHNPTSFADLQGYAEDNLPEFATDIIRKYESGVYTKFVINMNPGNNEGTSLDGRLAHLNGLDTKTKFALLAEYGVHGTDSTQNLLYDGYHIHDFENFDEMNESEQTEVLEKYKDHLPLYFDIKKNYDNAYNFIIKTNPTPKQMSSLIGILANMGKIESFFNLIGTVEQQNEIVEKFLLGIESSSDKVGKMTGIVELLASPKLGAVKEIAIRGIESSITKLEAELADKSTGGTESKKDALLWYNLILASHYKRLSGISDGEPEYDKVQVEIGAISDIAKKSVDRYGDKLPLFERILKEKLFTNGVHVQYNPFFNNLPDQTDNNLKDRDGHNSLQKTVEYYGGHIKYTEDGHIKSVRDGSGAKRKGRHLELRSLKVGEKDMQYVIMSQVKGGRSVVLIMNSPKLLNKEIIEFYKHMQVNPIIKGLDGKLVTDVHGFKLRGHGISSITDTGAEIFKNMRQTAGYDIPLASYGSCGGNSYGLKIAKVSPGSLYSGFTSTGMAFVNLNLQRGEINFMLEHEYYDTKSLQEDADRRFQGYSARMQSGYKSFRWAHQNIPQKVSVAFDSIKDDKK